MDAKLLASLFRRALLKELNGETKERRFLKMLGKDYLDAERDKPLIIELVRFTDSRFELRCSSKQ